MALTMVNSVRLRPERIRDFETLVGELAAAAAGSKEPWRWTAHQPIFGDAQSLHFVYEAEGFAALEKLGTVDELWRRVLGDKRGEERFRETNACLVSAEHTVSIDRPDLSYLPPRAPARPSPLAVVTVVLSRPGHADACEELIRKLAEAIPKVDEPMHIATYQSVTGNLLGYWTVRALETLGQIDALTPTPELLTRAFGAAEGGLIWRSGNEAITQARREILRYREDLSNPR